MSAEIVDRGSEYVLNHCTKLLARDNTDGRHSFFGTQDGHPRARTAETWRFPIVDAHQEQAADRFAWNDVTFVTVIPPERDAPNRIELVTSAHRLNDPIELRRVEDSIFFARTLRVPTGQRHRYRFIIDGASMLDPINPQTEALDSGETWSTFFTWLCTQPISFERWELALLDRLTRHILPFNSLEAENFQEREANEGSTRHLYRLDISAGVANYIDKIVAREERHQLGAYKTCLELLDRILRRRNPGKDPEFLFESQFLRLYDEMDALAPALFADGWDRNRYNDPQYFLKLLRRHAWTGAFAHPKYGGNPGGMAWAYLSERFRTDAGTTAFDWRRAIEPPLGTSTEYLG
jgi:hypothetical protein